MARSNHIYIALFAGTGELYGAFTVKHELVDAIRHNPDKYVVKRVKDGVPHTDVEIKVTIQDYRPPSTLLGPRL